MARPEPPKRNNLKIILHERRIQQKDLAKLANLETYQISNYVSGKYDDILLGTAIKICYALNCSIEEAFGDKMKEMRTSVRLKLNANDND
jgi:DNA-binding Xre family transcriptional regulator